MPMNSMTIIKVLLVHDCNNISETSYILNLIIIFLAQRLKKKPTKFLAVAFKNIC